MGRKKTVKPLVTLKHDYALGCYWLSGLEPCITFSQRKSEMIYVEEDKAKEIIEICLDDSRLKPQYRATEEVKNKLRKQYQIIRKEG